MTTHSGSFPNDPLYRTHRWSGEFRDTEVERLYREEMIVTSSSTYMKAAIGIAFAFPTFSLLDLGSLGFGDSWATLLVARTVVAVVVLAVAWRIRVAPRSFVDGSGLWLLSSTQVLLFATVLCAAAVRPVDAVTNALSAVVLMLVALVVVPGRFWAQLALATSLLGGLVVVSATRFDDPALPLGPLIANLVAALLWGAFILMLSNRRQRQQWCAARRERRTSDRLAAELDIAAELRTELQRLARQDPLTHAANRREFLRVASESLGTGHPAAPLALVMMDVDRFKSVNDRFGHGTGDAVLIELVRTISAELRDGDLLARLGGEEFAVLLPGLDRIDAGSAAERIRSAVASGPSPSGSGPPITVSIGVATAAPDDSVDALLARADRCMYDAKRSGGDAVRLESHHSVAPPSDPMPSPDLASALVEVDDQ